MQGISSASWKITRITVKTWRFFSCNQWNGKNPIIFPTLIVAGTTLRNKTEFIGKSEATHKHIATWIGIDATIAASTPKIMFGSPPHLRSMSIVIWPFLRLWTRIPAWNVKEKSKLIYTGNLKMNQLQFIKRKKKCLLGDIKGWIAWSDLILQSR